MKIKYTGKAAIMVGEKTYYENEIIDISEASLETLRHQYGNDVFEDMKEINAKIKADAKAEAAEEKAEAKTAAAEAKALAKSNESTTTWGDLNATANPTPGSVGVPVSDRTTPVTTNPPTKVGGVKVVNPEPAKTITPN